MGEERRRPLIPLQQRIEYGIAYRIGLRRVDCTPEVWRELRSIEHAVIALEQDKWFLGQFASRGQTVMDVVGGVNNLDQLFMMVDRNCEGRRKEEHMRQWGQRMVVMTLNHQDGNDELNGHHQRIREFVESKASAFHLELVPVK